MDRSVLLAILAFCAWQNSSAREMTVDSPAVCPVTKPAEAFTPPAPYSNHPPAGSIFFGTSKLWTLVWMNAWQGQKLVWFSPDNYQDTDSTPGLTVTAKRLDASALMLTTDHSNWAYVPGRTFITTSFRAPPIAGCWEITGRLKGSEVKYFVWLGPRPKN